jgi:hypothetical protein
VRSTTLYIFKCSVSYMLNYARQTLKRVPSFQELLQGKMGSAKEEMYPHRPAIRHHRARADTGAVLLMCSLLAPGQRVWEQQSASTRLYVHDTVEDGGAAANKGRTAPHG